MTGPAKVARELAWAHAPHVGSAGELARALEAELARRPDRDALVRELCGCLARSVFRQVIGRRAGTVADRLVNTPDLDRPAVFSELLGVVFPGVGRRQVSWGSAVEGDHLARERFLGQMISDLQRELACHGEARAAIRSAGALSLGGVNTNHDRRVA